MESSLLLANNIFFIFIFTIIAIFLILKNKRYSVFHIIVIYLTLSLVDVFMPSVLWTIYGHESKPEFLNSFTNSELFLGFLYYIMFYIIMFLTMMIFSKANQVRWLISYKEDNYYIKSRIN